MLLAESPGAVSVTLEPAHQILTGADEGADAGAGPAPDSQAGDTLLEQGWQLALGITA